MLTFSFLILLICSYIESSQRTWRHPGYHPQTLFKVSSLNEVTMKG